MAFGTIMGQTPDLTDYIKKTGDTLTGPLLYDGVPSVGNELVNKDYVDSMPGQTIPYIIFSRNGTSKEEGNWKLIYNGVIFGQGNAQTVNFAVRLPGPKGRLLIKLSGEEAPNQYIIPTFKHYDLNLTGSGTSFDMRYPAFATIGSSAAVKTVTFQVLNIGDIELRAQFYLTQEPAYKQIEIYFDKS